MTPRTRTAAVLLLAAVPWCLSSLVQPAAARAASVVISPLPGTPTAMPQTQISFLGASASSLSKISVVGSASGRHRGRLRSYASSTGASFLPSKPFTPGESVTVHAKLRASKATFKRPRNAVISAWFGS